MFSTDNLAENNDINIQSAGNCIMIEPPKPIKKFIYLCDRRFHVEHIEKLYQDYDKYGIIIIGGDEVKFYEVCGTEIKRIARDKIKLPKNQRKGGQSAPRFGRIREEMIDRYIGQCSQICREIWLTEGLPNIRNMVIAGVGDKKDKLFDDLAPTLKNISYKLCTDVTDPEKIIEKALEIIDINKDNTCAELEIFFKNIELDNDRSIYGMEQMKEYLDEEKLEKILIHENHTDFHQFIEKRKEKRNNLIIVKKIYKNSDLFLKGYGGLGGISYY